MHPPLLYVIVLLSYVIVWCDGHGRLIEPPSRASAWRYGFDTPHDYNDHESYCGGFTRQWQINGGKCGVCGDPWDAPTPRAHEYGGTYGQGVIVRRYTPGAIITTRVELTANHNGYFEFALCADYKRTNQECLDRNILQLYRPQDGVEHLNRRFFPSDGNRVYEMRHRLPEGKTCAHCVIQWRYIAGNNWGTCANGTGAVGCGPQEEFRACADVAISRDGIDGTNEVDDDDVELTVAPPSHEIHPEESSTSPIVTLIVAMTSFLVVFLIFFLSYIHFYQIGGKIKQYLKGGNTVNQDGRTPLPPPRTKRGKDEEKSESLA